MTPAPGGQRQHRCAAFGCKKWVGWRFLMCPAHWALVPRKLQRDVYAAWNNGNPSSTYTAARSAAVASVIKQGDLFSDAGAT